MRGKGHGKRKGSREVEGVTKDSAMRGSELFRKDVETVSKNGVPVFGGTAMESWDMGGKCANGGGIVEQKATRNAMGRELGGGDVGLGMSMSGGKKGSIGIGMEQKISEKDFETW